MLVITPVFFYVVVILKINLINSMKIMSSNLWNNFICS